jgi:hypothetical protein
MGMLRHHFELLLRKRSVGNHEDVPEQVGDVGWLGGGLRGDVQIAFEEHTEKKDGLERGSQLRLQHAR